MGAWAADVADWWGEEFSVWGLEFSVWGLEFRVQGLGGVLWVAGDGDVRLGCWGAGFGGLGGWGLGFRGGSLLGGFQVELKPEF